ncbi:hypothetical protein [Streptomyces sp. NPDC018584]|uniref:hypothetical protein n=1 Tax=unclassified Streptomyces TaxID=2593676 RepID=UPI003791A496
MERTTSGGSGRRCRDDAVHPPAEGWPIATGLIEGACGHLLGDLDAYFVFHLAREHERLYSTSDQHDYDRTV